MVNIITTAHQPAIAVNPALPQELSDVIDRTLTKDPNDRIRTARELADLLEGIAARVTGTPYPGMPVRPRTSIAPSPTPTETWVDVRSGRKESNALVWASGAIFAVAVVGIGAIAIARSAPPVVDVAARSTAVFLHARERLAATLAGMPVTQPEAPSTAIPATTGAAIELSQQPSAEPHSTGSARATTSAAPTKPPATGATPTATPPKKKKGGGVTKPGF
jgi:hypothetical protein